MPQHKKTPDSKSEAPEGCILQIGKFNNIVRRKEQLENECTGLYGIMGMLPNDTSTLPDRRRSHHVSKCQVQTI